MPNKTKAVLLMWLVILSLVSTAVTHAAPVTLQVWNSDANPAILDWYNNVLIPEFEKSHPGVTVIVTKTPWGTNYTNKIVTSYAAGVGPDIIYGGAEFVDGFVENGFVSPIDDLVKTWPDWKDIIPPTLGAVTYKGHTYGVPIFMDFRTTVINRQVLFNAGYNPDNPPSTWSDFVSTAKRLIKRNGDNFDVYGMFVGSGYQDFNQMVWQNGGNILNDTKTAPTFTDQAGVDALTFWVNAVKETSNNGKQLGGLPDLVQGRVGMFFQAQIKPYAVTAHSAQMDESDIAGSIVAPIGHQVRQAVMYNNWMGIGSQSAHKDLAWAFLKLHFALANYTEYTRVGDIIPTRLSMLRSELFKSNPWLNKVLMLASTYGRSTWTAVEFARLRDTLGPELTKAMKGQIPPREALDNAANQWMSILNEKH